MEDDIDTIKNIMSVLVSVKVKSRNWNVERESGRERKG